MHGALDRRDLPMYGSPMVLILLPVHPNPGPPWLLIIDHLFYFLPSASPFPALFLTGLTPDQKKFRNHEKAITQSVLSPMNYGVTKTSGAVAVTCGRAVKV